MAAELRMPDMGTVEGEVTLVRWLKAEGDTVVLGEPLFEVETDKGVSEVEAAMAGVLVKLLVAEGAKAGSGEPIALIRRPGEADDGGSAAVVTAPAASDKPAAAARPAASAAPAAARSPTPVIRALAEKHGVDLSAVKGTGPGGRILREDVLRAGKAGPTPRAPATPVPAAQPLASAGTGASLSPSQAIVARKVSQSHREKPVYRVNALVDMSKAIALRDRAKAGGEAVGWDALLVKAAAKVVMEMPLFRRYLKAEAGAPGSTSAVGMPGGTPAARMPGGTPAAVAEHNGADIAVAIGVGDDLFIPAVRSAAAKSAAAISREIEALARKAEGHALTAQDVDGSCFLVSNLGMFPIDSFDAIIYPEHSAALAVGAIKPTPVSDGKSIWIAPMARLTLSVDHRLINGRAAAQFLSRVKQILENGELA